MEKFVVGYASCLREQQGNTNILIRCERKQSNGIQTFES